MNWITTVMDSCRWMTSLYCRAWCILCDRCKNTFMHVVFRAFPYVFHVFRWWALEYTMSLEVPVWAPELATVTGKRQGGRGIWNTTPHFWWTINWYISKYIRRVAHPRLDGPLLAHDRSTDAARVSTIE